MDDSHGTISADNRELLDLMDQAQRMQDGRTYDALDRHQDACDRMAMRMITQTSANADSIAEALGSDPTS